MITKFIEATDAGEFNWGKFLVGRFTAEEWAQPSVMLPTPSLLRTVGWSSSHTLVVDLQTGEGIIVDPQGSARADLNQKHQVWVCPMFEPFLVWLYQQDLRFLTNLPSKINLGNVPTAMHGYRRTRKESA